MTLREHRTKKYICREIDITVSRFEWFERNSRTFRGCPLPAISKKRGFKIIFDKKQADDFIAGVNKFTREHMNIKETAEYLDVSTYAMERSKKTGLVLHVPIELPVLVDGRLWWKRASVELCKERIHDVGREFA